MAAVSVSQGQHSARSCIWLARGLQLCAACFAAHKLPHHPLAETWTPCRCMLIGMCTHAGPPADA